MEESNFRKLRIKKRYKKGENYCEERGRGKIKLILTYGRA